MSDRMKVNLVGVTLEEEMVFKCDLGKINMEDLYIDERELRDTEKIGPSPARLLALAVLGCMGASFAFCLKKRGFTLEELDGKAEIIIYRNEKGFWRVKKINLEINPKIDNPKMRKRADQCRKFFEQYCIITQSVREGIEVNLKLDY
jgi:uncharacterized OsmC-like protein